MASWSTPAHSLSRPDRRARHGWREPGRAVPGGGGGPFRISGLRVVKSKTESNDTPQVLTLLCRMGRPRWRSPMFERSEAGEDRVPSVMGGPVVGIDLGTTNSVVAVVNEFGRAEIITNREGSRITPSVVLFDDEEPVVGEIAKSSAIVRPLDTAQFAKRHMGDRDWSFRTSSGNVLRAEEISAAILARLKSDAELHLGCSITRAVISVPAYFDDVRRTATVDAATMAGLEVVGLLNEPTAAALSYGLDTRSGETVLVYDLGGGTFDVTIMRLASGDAGEFVVLATDGDTRLGGCDWDELLMTWLNDRFLESGGPDLFEDPASEQLLRDAAVRVKHTLSQRDEANAYLSFRGFHSKIGVSRARFNEITAPLLQRTVECLRRAMGDADVLWSDIDRVVLVGGSTRMPQVIDLIRTLSGRAPQSEVNPDEAVALGASIYAALVTGGAENDGVPLVDATGRRVGEIAVQDITAHSMGVLVILDDNETHRNSIIIPKGTPIPCSRTKKYATTEDDQQFWCIRVTEGEDTDADQVVTVGSGRVVWPKGLPEGTISSVEMSYDSSGLITMKVELDDGSKVGEVEIERSANMTDTQLERGRAWLDSSGVA